METDRSTDHPRIARPRSRRTASMPESELDDTPHIGVVVMAFIGVLCAVRGWQIITPAQRWAQVALSAACFGVCTVALGAPRLFACHRPLLVSVSRFSILMMPAATELIAGLLGGPPASGIAISLLGVRWAYRNPLGPLGLMLFASRLMLVGVAPLYTPMSLGASAVSQIALAAAASANDHVMCTSPLADGPEVLPWLRAMHRVLSGAWELVAPVPWNPLPPPGVAAPGVSLLAVTLLVRLAFAVAPLAANAAREAQEHRALLLAVAQGGVAAARGRALPKRTPAAARIDAFFRRLRRHPAHAALFGLACLEAAWCGCFAAAQRVCAA